MECEEQTLAASSRKYDTDISSSPHRAIDITRSQMKNYREAEEDLKEFESRQEFKDIIDSETDEESKNAATDNEMFESNRRNPK